MPDELGPAVPEGAVLYRGKCRRCGKNIVRHVVSGFEKWQLHCGGCRKAGTDELREPVTYRAVAIHTPIYLSS